MLWIEFKSFEHYSSQNYMDILFGLDFLLAIHSLQPTNYIPFYWKWLIKPYLPASHFLIYLPRLPTKWAPTTIINMA